MIKNKKILLILYTLAPAILFWLSWPPRDLFFLSFIAFVPLFLLEQRTHDYPKSGWLIYLSLFLWNLVISWWVGFADFYSSIFMLFANAGLMYLPWLGYRKGRKIVSDEKAFLIFVALWLSFEYLHLNWQITWPWFTLGNIFAKHNEVVQWYEITGVLGGSLWVLVANICWYIAITKKTKSAWIISFTTICVPALISIPFYLTHSKDYDAIEMQNRPRKALLVQPNIDPYTKFNTTTEISNFKEMLSLIETKMNDSIDYVILPETAIVEYVDEKNLDRFTSIRIVKHFVKKYPQIHLVSGISTYKFFNKNERLSSTARQTESGEFYDSYNTALIIDSTKNIDFYHKGKLVPGAEILPYPKLFGFLSFLSINLGGVSGSLGSDKEALVFNAGNKPNLAPLICYESVFSGHVAQFCRKGAEILLVITNDGWWRDTDGYKQHMHYASLRAIENRREVLRSANTGITCRIDKLGRIQEQTTWWEKDIIAVDVYPFQNMTFYATYGDYLGRLASFMGVFFILGMLVKRKN